MSDDYNFLVNFLQSSTLGVHKMFNPRLDAAVVKIGQHQLGEAPAKAGPQGSAPRGSLIGALPCS
jgi:hypothetical protein